MKQITRDLYTSGRVWLSLSHSFTMKPKDGTEIELLKINGDFVTLNAGALFVLSFWSSGNKTPKKFYIPEYKIEDFREMLSILYRLKSDEAYVRNGELTEIAKPSKLYYRIANNDSFIDLYLIENDFNGDKSINVAIELNLTTKSDITVYSMYDSNVTDIINAIPTPSEIIRYKQSAAELCYIQTLFNRDTFATPSKEETPRKQGIEKESEPKTINRVDRTHVSNKTEPKKSTEIETPRVEKDSSPKSGYNYEELLSDE